MEQDWRNGYNNPYSHPRSHSPPVMGYPPQSNFMRDSYSNNGLLSSGMIKPTSNFMGPWHTQQLDKATTARNMMGQAHVHSREATTAARSSSKVKETELIIGAEETAWSALDIGGLGLVNIAKELYRFTFLTHLYLNHNQLVFLSPEICLLKNLKFLDLTGNKLSTLPPEIGLVTSLVELWLFDNQISYLPNEMGQLYQLEFLGIDGNNLLADPFDSLIRKEGTSAAIAYLRDTCPVRPMPAEREWIQLEEETSQEVFTIMCYNTLCENYATPQVYGYTPSWALAWSYRKDLLLQDILNYSADIVCLQEVEAAQFKEFFTDQLSQLGEYSGVFYPKSRARTMSEADKKHVDGCATFFKTSKFRLLEKHHIEFQQVAMQRPDLRKTEDAFNRVMIKDNIAVVTLLEHKVSGQRIVVANAHLHWDPAFKDVKLIQSGMLMEELTRLVNEWNRNLRGKHLPVLIAGDFNSLPDSGVVEFLSQGSVGASHDDFGSHSYGEYTERGLSHSFPLKSAYSHTDAIDFTNFTPSFKGVIDYIWYTTTSVVVCGLLAHVDKEYMRQCVGFPNAHHPSDHIPLVIAFRCKK